MGRSSSWMKAAEFYKAALDSLDSQGQSAEKPHLAEELAKCYYRESFVCSTRANFMEMMTRAKHTFEHAASLYDNAGLKALFQRARARGLFCDYWLREFPAKASIVERCIILSSEAVTQLDKGSMTSSALETRKDILLHLRESLHIATQWEEYVSQFWMAVELGRKIAESPHEDEVNLDILESTHALLWFLTVESEVILEPSEFSKLSKEAKIHLETLLSLSGKINSSHSKALAMEAAADIAWDFDGNMSEARALYEKALSYAKLTGDSYLTGRICTILANFHSWLGSGAESIEDRRTTIDSGLKYAQDAIRHLQIPLHTSYLTRAYGAAASCHIDLATLVETDPEKKRSQLVRAVEIASQGIRLESGTNEWQGCAHELSKAMYFLALATRSPREKERLLREALPIRERSVRVVDTLQPHAWNRGVMRNYLALVKAALASIEGDPESGKRMIVGAVNLMEECIAICEKWKSTIPGALQRLARYTEWFGDILVQLFRLNLERESARQAIQAYQESRFYFDKAGASGPQSALSWKVAKVNDSLGNFIEASQSFKRASEEYRLVAEKIPALTKTFNDLASYMEGWANIEEARQYHSEEKYGRSHTMYQKAAEILETTKTWNGLAMLLHARSSLEKGEALSRQEKHVAAAKYLKKALDRSRHSRKELEKMRTTVTDVLEGKEIDDWIKIAEHREAYAAGRIELEEGRSLDRSGDKIASARKYRSAFLSLKMLAEQTVAAEDRAEIDTLAQLCKSWALRKEAESMSSPDLFAQAAESFARAKESATRQSLRLLALGDASICRALEFGTRFRQSRDIRLYSDVKRHLEVAADHYTEAGFRKAASWTRATQRIFDALLLLTDAEVELDVKKKRELYHLAEKDYALAARLYGEAGFDSKKRDALEQLKRAREGKEVFLTPLETLEEIPPVSATYFPQIPLRGAQPLGLERFEEAKVTGELRAPQTHLTTESDFTVSIDMANVGKTPATLIKLEGVVPEGCDPVEKQGTPNLEGRSLDLKGKRLEYLMTYGVQVSFRPTRKGEFELSPRVVYVDERGNYKSTNLQTLYLIVREPGVSEGFHAPPTVHLPQDFQFETERSRQVFSRLVKEFLDDYMTKRIVMERAGWRSLMDVIRDVKIPRSALYGPAGRTGPVLAELERRGLVETRVFPKERGRGGEIKKVRVAYENTIVRRIVDRAVMENA